MYFPTAGIEANPLLPVCVAFVVSFFASMGGISGAFLLLPFQMSVLGYTSPSVSATNQFYNIVAIPSGVARYIREGRMVWPLVWVVVAGTLPGVLVGAFLRVTWLPDARDFKLFAGLVLLYIGFRMIRDLLRPARNGKIRADERFAELAARHRAHAQALGVAPESLPTTRVVRCTWRTVEYEFYGEPHAFPVQGTFILSLVVGMVGGTYGIGGGAIIAPFLISVFGLPVHTVAGAALMGTFVTSIAGVLFYMGIAPLYPSLSVSPDWMLGLMLGLGGMCGMYLGARCQKHVPARIIKWMLAVVLSTTAARYVIGYFF